MTREPEWDDENRDQALEFSAWKASICGCGCGLPAAESHDPKRAFTIQSTTCYARKAIEKVRRDNELANQNDKDGIWASGLFLYAEAGPTPTGASAGAVGEPGTPPMSRIERIRRGLT